MGDALRVEHDVMQRKPFTTDESQRLARKMELAEGIEKLLTDVTVEGTRRQNMAHRFTLSHRAVPAPRLHVLEAQPVHGVVEFRTAVAQATAPG